MNTQRVAELTLYANHTEARPYRGSFAVVPVSLAFQLARELDAALARADKAESLVHQLSATMDAAASG